MLWLEHKSTFAVLMINCFEYLHGLFKKPMLGMFAFIVAALTRSFGMHQEPIDRYNRHFRWISIQCIYQSMQWRPTFAQHFRKNAVHFMLFTPKIQFSMVRVQLICCCLQNEKQRFREFTVNPSAWHSSARVHWTLKAFASIFFLHSTYHLDRIYVGLVHALTSKPLPAY